MRQLTFKDLLIPSSNVRVVLRDRKGRIAARRESHNVFTNQGRTWLRNHIPAKNFTGVLATANRNVCNGTPAGNADALSPVGKTFKPRYIGIGVGGALQTILTPGGQTENASITRLERPVRTAPAKWLQQVTDHDDLASTQQFPDAYTVRFRAIFGYDEISFTAQPIYGTNVPVSEVMLFTSEAGQNDTPTNVGAIAYNLFSPVSVTPNFLLEISWDLTV